MTQKPTAPAPTDRKIARKWGRPLAAAGWTAIPNVIVKRQKALGLTPLDVNIILQLLTFWWEPGNLPRPTKTTIAAAIGVNPRTVQRRIASLEGAGFISRVARRSASGGSGANSYDISGLIKAAEPFAVEELQEIEGRKRAAADKLKRKRARLRVV